MSALRARTAAMATCSVVAEAVARTARLATARTAVARTARLARTAAVAIT